LGLLLRWPDLFSLLLNTCDFAISEQQRKRVDAPEWIAGQLRLFECPLA